MNDKIAILADPGRRTVLSCLDDHRGAVDIETLATDVVAAQEGTSREAVTEADRDTALIRLHHVDLPKLDEAGFVEFDHEGGMVRRCRSEMATISPVMSD
ncbi:hypothetical protein GL213_08050 [Halogeometricum borinquense]|uniref:DUF7344 domain-containing protein n=1 Tax=Halogeometricum borinquense TaxID=60847 RepID=A0A6C0UGG0_9EURY|nr:hypothetical protein [Halogeometricum borinquense]QIB74576.1 hypothetical protein G3I44_09940 [Halogeometricum borinquense]QIQ76477.1 hypothetical protein GL213_08050 [Halogeometricum borinquense]